MRRSLLLLVFATACASGGGDDTVDAAPMVYDAAPDAAPFTPRTLDGLVLWLDPDVGQQATGASLVGWGDHSGNGNDATPGATKPVVISGLINGKPAIRFDGAQTYLGMPDSQTMRWGTGDYVVEVVAAYRNPAASYAMLFGKSTQTSPYAGAVLFVNFPFPSPATILAAQADSQSNLSHDALGTTTGLNDNHFHLFGMRHNGNMLEVRVNGVAEAMVDVTGVNADAPGVLVTIGGQAKIVQMLDGDVAEVVAVKGTVSDADVAQLEAYLKTKYAL